MRLIIWTLALALAGCAAQPASEPVPDEPQKQEAVAEPGPDAGPEEAPVGEREPVPPEVLYEVFAAEVAGHREDYVAAARHYLAAAHDSSDPEIAERATQIALYAGDNEIASQAVARLLELTPGSRRAHTTAVTLALHRQDDAMARRHLEGLLALADEPREGWRQVAQLLSRAPDAAFALARMDELVSEHPEEAHAWHAYSQLQSHFENLEAALEHADRALALAPRWAEGLAWRGRLKISSADYEGAVRDLESALELEPSDRQARLHYAEALRRAGEYERAHEALEALPPEPALLETRASLAIEAENWELAESLYRRLLDERGHDQQARFFLGQIAEVQKRYDEALDWYGQVNHEELRLDARIRQAVVLSATERLDEALALLAELRTEGPESAEESRLAEARLLADAGRIDDAFEAYERGLDELGDDGRLRYARALLAAEQGRLELAEADLRLILERDPDDAHALNALGYTLADQTDRLDEALELINRAYELEPDDAAIVDSMGWVHYRRGNHERALEYLRQALDMQFDAEIAAHLGEVLWVSGDRDAARAVWQRALEELPEQGDLVRETMDRLTP